jgi:hypothetical protein
MTAAVTAAATTGASTTAPAALAAAIAATTAENVGLFFVRYHVGTGSPSAPMLTLALAIDTVDRMISGGARLAQTISPPLDPRMSVHGTYTPISMPSAPGIIATLVGYIPLHWPSGDGIGPVLLPNLHLHLQLDNDFQSGRASYRYLDPTGQWTEVNGMPVRKQ